MLEKILAVTKSNVGSIRGVAKSKKYALALVAMTACYVQAAEEPARAVECCAIAALVAVGYVIGQSIVEAAAAHGADKKE